MSLFFNFTILCYPLDRDLFGGKQYPPFEELGSVVLKSLLSQEKKSKLWETKILPETKIGIISKLEAKFQAMVQKSSKATFIWEVQYRDLYRIKKSLIFGVSMYLE